MNSFPKGAPGSGGRFWIEADGTPATSGILANRSVTACTEHQRHNYAIPNLSIAETLCLRAARFRAGAIGKGSKTPWR